MSDFLAAILARIRSDQEEAFRHFQPSTFTLRGREKPRNILPLLENGFALIAEIKRGSPSAGSLLPAGVSAADVARSYEKNGAAAVSVVTEKNYFFGHGDLLAQVKAAVHLPVLRKDFIIHPLQIYESYNQGADFILLIAACLGDGELREFIATADALGLPALVEVHDRGELERTLALQPRLIGINNRSLHDFSVDWKRSLVLRPFIPPGLPVICESGIGTASQIRVLRQEGFAGALVGEHLLRQADPGLALNELLHGQA